MSSYDSNRHQEFIDILQKRSGRMVWVYTAMAALFGVAMGLFLARAVGNSSVYQLALVWAAIMACFGFVSGKERKFALQMKAQEMLWQKQVEENTHSQVQVSAVAAGK
jgi:positive regulator of sigma E activity